MTLYKSMFPKTKYFVIVFFIITSYTYSQDQLITTPKIESPEEEFISIFQKDKFSNPIFLNGNVQTVSKKVTEHITPNREVSTQENYEYSLNKLKQIIRYSSDVEFDELTPEFLNLEKEVVIKGDTIINHDNLWYTFNSDQLITKTEKNLNELVMDSLSFRYAKNKLVEIKEYRRDVVTEVNESSGGLIEYNILYSDYEIHNYRKADYSLNNLLETKLEISTIEETIFYQKTNYLYNEFNKIASFKKNSFESLKEEFDMSDYIKIINTHNTKMQTVEIVTSTAHYTYDDKNRVTNVIIDKLKEGKLNFKIKYKKNKFVIDFSKNDIVKVQYEFVYDKHKNPIQENKFIYIDGKKHLDTSTLLDIKYY